MNCYECIHSRKSWKNKVCLSCYGTYGPMNNFKKKGDVDGKEVLICQLLEIKRIADGKVHTFSCQGQAMDGYSELANYRSIITKLEELEAVE